MAESAKTLGIIGGAGVGAAAQLYIDVSARYRAANAALPQIALWNLPLSDELEHSFLGAADATAIEAAESLVGQGVRRLAGAGAGVVAMPCNALQRVAATQTEQAGLPFVDMIAATIEAVRALGHEQAVLLAMPTTYAAGHYDGYGVEMIAPGAAERAEVPVLVARTVEGPPPSGAELLDLIERVRRTDAAVVIGCTDICGLIDPGDAPDVVESLACLAGACVQALAPAPVAASRA